MSTGGCHLHVVTSPSATSSVPYEATSAAVTTDPWRTLFLSTAWPLATLLARSMTSTPRAKGDSALVEESVPALSAVTASAMPSLPTTLTLPARPAALRDAMTPIA